MITGKGRTACQGVAIGTILEIEAPTVSDLSNDAYMSVEQELELLQEGLACAATELEELAAKTREQVGEDEAEILEMQRMMLDDPDICDAIIAKIKKGAISASKAAIEVGIEQAREFEALDDQYMRERAADVKDVTSRISRAILGTNVVTLTEPSIIVADDLTPSQTVAFDRKLILGFVLRKGTMNSHASILARTMNIPSLINTELPDEPLNGRILALDTEAQTFYLDPDSETIEHIMEAKDRFYARQMQLLKLRGKETVAPCGHRVKAFANIGRPDDVEAVLENDAEGIGLYRSEFLYIGKETYPSEEEQYRAYAKVASTMNGKLVIIRTLDIGADKVAHYFNLPEEENPALGMRAIRICLTRPEIFKTQLRALYRAAARGNIAIMLPMITSVDEVLKAKAICAEVEQELKNEGIEYKVPSLGIMIETPAAAILSDRLAKVVDFFSVGTNDLLQYTCAIDRQNQTLGDFYDPHHPALLEFLRIIAKNAHDNGIWVGICGELGGDLELTDTFIEYGYDELSVSPSAVLPLREKVLKSKAQCKNILSSK
ncbi:phosphoenolpyruvate--protein phosphotransferase [Anaerobiospirillum thomasii]|uniref:Phosphoenolpyruvate-protein phosphotransferase n=1 Tax=Anaerobiospirillum thomasii TaxID=179995 RepID=A0A2X0WVR5_9GAMM|nr:phosphoenolpyruvate--protein phosphotransferase [Anaerobiospirillum thomasii]SPT70572.1 Phosphoenolpyruvate-protein phosphotransferase [Anaerobiospirillum thomasii]